MDVLDIRILSRSICLCELGLLLHIISPPVEVFFVQLCFDGVFHLNGFDAQVITTTTGAIL